MKMPKLGSLGQTRMRALRTVVAMVFLVASPAAAIEFRGGDEVVVAAGEVIGDDLYVSGDTLTIDGIVEGDLIAFGRLVSLNGTVTGDFVAAGQAVDINGTVGDDARIAGQVLRLGSGAEVRDDLLGAGFSLETGDESVVLGSIIYAGFQGLFTGWVGEGLQVSADRAELRGTVAGDVSAEVGGGEGPSPAMFMPPPPVPMPTVPQGLTIADSTVIGGNVEYTSAQEAAVGDGAQLAGEVVHQVPEVALEAPPEVGTSIWRAVRRFISLALIGLLGLWLAPGALDGSAGTLSARPVLSVVMGVVGLIGGIVAGLALIVVCILLCVIVSGIKLGGLVPLILAVGGLAEASLGLSMWVGLAYVAQIVVSLVVGRWLLARFGREAAPASASLLAGLVVFGLLRAIPFLGGLIGLLVALGGFGAAIVWAGGWPRSAEAEVSSAPA